MTTPLTPRHKQIVRLIAEGLLYKEIARELGISEHGVQMNVDRIKKIISVRGAADITRYALAKRLVENEFLRK